ncbi:MAG TPA: acetamidase/formamidase family protein [Pseudolabrys sp.]|nr:acetamidase/formamidase family protein [Pseudolabrys sp.]
MSSAIPRVDAGADTVHWGHFSAALKPVLTVDSGARVIMSSVSGQPDVMPKPPFTIPPALPAIHAANAGQRFLVHMCTGPVAVRGAKAGQVLQIDIEAIEPFCDWGYTLIRPQAGGLPEDFPEYRLYHVAIDKQRMLGRMPWGQEIPLKPFFGVMAVAPPAEWGTIPTPPPRRNGGNMDLKELVAGATLYLPVFTDGALFSVGDGHGAQGDGEVCITAIETGLVGTFRLSVRDDMKLQWPRAETPTHLITMGFDPDLDECAKIALRQMIDVISTLNGIDRYQAYAMASLTADLRVTQIVNGVKGVHCMIEKRYLNG